MKLPRFSLASIGFAILILAIDFAVMRLATQSFEFSQWRTFAFLLLPMLDLMLIALYRTRRRDRRTSGAIGFLISGLAAAILVFVFCLIAPDTAIDRLRAIGQPIAAASMNGLTRLLSNGVMQRWGMKLTLGIVFELLFPMAFFCLPPLSVAILGGWLAPRTSPLRRVASEGIQV